MLYDKRKRIQKTNISHSKCVVVKRLFRLCGTLTKKKPASLFTHEWMYWGWCGVVPLVLFPNIFVSCASAFNIYALLFFLPFIFLFSPKSWEVNIVLCMERTLHRCPMPIDKLQIGKTPLIYFGRVKMGKNMCHLPIK